MPKKRRDLTHALPCRVRQDEDGLLRCVPTRTESKRGLAAMSAANAICLIRPQTGETDGAAVDIVWLPFHDQAPDPAR